MANWINDLSLVIRKSRLDRALGDTDTHWNISTELNAEAAQYVISAMCVKQTVRPPFISAEIPN